MAPAASRAEAAAERVAAPAALPAVADDEAVRRAIRPRHPQGRGAKVHQTPDNEVAEVPDARVVRRRLAPQRSSRPARIVCF